LSFYIFEKNNLQIFDELVLSVAKMLSCGDAKGRGGGYSMNYLRPPGLPNVKLRILKTCGNYIKIGEL
jgi:hypothetical protein